MDTTIKRTNIDGVSFRGEFFENFSTAENRRMMSSLRRAYSVYKQRWQRHLYLLKTEGEGFTLVVGQLIDPKIKPRTFPAKIVHNAERKTADEISAFCDGLVFGLS